jgi:hypothetical protein
MAVTDPPEFLPARQRSEDEEERIAAAPTREQRRAALDRLREQHATQVAKAHGGQGVLPTIGES